MKKSDLVTSFTQTYPDLSKAQAKEVVDTMFESLISGLAEQKRVELRGFGSFSLRQHKPRVVHNPRTKAFSTIEGRIFPYFRCGKALFDHLNDNETS